MSKRKKATEIQLCPKCKKPTLVPASNVSGWLDTATYRCTDVKCGYTGHFFITVNPDELMKRDSGDREEPAPEDGAERG